MFNWFESLIDPFRPAPEAMPPRSVARFYWHFIRQAWPIFVMLTVVGFFVAIVEVVMFDYLGKVVDLVNTTPAAQLFAQHGDELLWMAAVMLIARPLCLGLHDLLLNQTVHPSMTNLVRWQTHRYMLRQSLSFFQNDFAGRVANRIMQTGPSLRESTTQTFDALWYVIVYSASAIYLFAQADVWLVVPLAVWIVIYIGLLFYFVPRVKLRSWRASDARSKLMGRIVDGYTNIATLKLFAHSRREEEYVAEAMVEQTQRSRDMTRMTTLMGISITTLNGLLIVGTCGLALWLWHQGSISVGAIALATGLVIRIHNMSGWIMWTVNGIFEDIGTVQDGIETISRPLTVVDRDQAQPLRVEEGGVRFENVHFHYGQDSGLIADLDLAVKPGEKIGLVGPSGAGKSTLMNILLRLYDLEGGRILIDGQDIAGVTQESLRSQIGVVTQDTSLLHRSIRDNLLYGRPDASDEEMFEAARKARADEFIPRLIDGEGRVGYEALVGERGVKLSGGQRQRVAIARVLLKNAPILILDEATSALDSEAEAAIQESLETLMEGKTVIAIAHRLSTIARMDRLVVMDKGHIIETGTHEELIAREGLYARLWKRQTGGFVAVDA
ncbi:ABC transporter ATP-binding protein [Lysobacter sp. ISL-50]|uniref:ABC transporter ATP-binding protein n=1 Tax=unclassified Lysobacter TaxID=2635362 RepID=UPI001BEBCF6A|nr:ABC transporter ATP-binding protein [Lysobacter sp. ISL-42]MBT2754245.1 ABC transporter ATP-binding protein [Lysobacter sp. ISL-50]MBT2779787.1 ABC transporter ATP-binding protein [Lysobacter sp. ISL-54]MBT2784558.1 ABC transporter ATP-binding protein [Lysobacter sp. ISL-52]